jgi:hypothetical protein
MLAYVFIYIIYKCIFYYYYYVYVCILGENVLFWLRLLDPTNVFQHIEILYDWIIGIEVRICICVHLHIYMCMLKKFSSDCASLKESLSKKKNIDLTWVINNIYIYIYTYIHVYKYIYIYLHIYILVYIYKEIQNILGFRTINLFRKYIRMYIYIYIY